MELTASLRKGQRVALLAGGFMLRGNIYGDAKKRHSDGWFFYTTKVIEEPEANLFVTSNGEVFRIETWSPPSKATLDYENIPADWPRPGNQNEVE